MSRLVYPYSLNNGASYDNTFVFSQFKTNTTNYNADPSDVFSIVGTNLCELVSTPTGSITLLFEGGTTLTISRTYQFGIDDNYFLSYDIEGPNYNGIVGFINFGTSPINTTAFIGIYPSNGDYNNVGCKFGLMGYQSALNNYEFITSTQTQTEIKKMFDSLHPLKAFDLKTEEDGGYGIPDWKSDTIPVPSLPMISVLDTGMVAMYELSLGECQAFAQYLWTSDFAANVKKMFQNPMEAIIGFSSVPFQPTGTINTPIELSWINTGCVGKKLSAQYYELNFGSLNVREMWSTFLDYQGTKIDIYLPYLGVRNIDVQDVMRGNINIKYHIDVWTGAFVVFLTSKRARGNESLNSVLYQWTGNCASEYPVSASNFADLYKSLISAGASTGVSVVTGNPLGVLGAGMALMNSGTGVSHADGGGCNTGIMGGLRPYLILSRPFLNLPENFGNNKGYISRINCTLNQCTGFTQVSSVHIDNITTATNEEKAEIEMLLKQGVIL